MALTSQGAATAADGGNSTGYLWHVKLNHNSHEVIVTGYDSANNQVIQADVWRKNSANFHFDPTLVTKVVAQIDKGPKSDPIANNQNHCFTIDFIKQSDGSKLPYPRLATQGDSCTID
jgi:hypothetical protein